MKVGIHTFRKFLVLALSALLLMCAAGLWVGCAEEKAEGGYTVTFMTDGGRTACSRKIRISFYRLVSECGFFR